MGWLLLLSLFSVVRSLLFFLLRVVCSVIVVEIACCVLSDVWCLLFVVCGVRHIMCCLLFVAWFVLFVACCVLLGVVV